MTARSPHAGTRPDVSMLIDLDRLLAAYDDLSPDPADPAQRVSFGTSGHRGTATAGTFNEAHVLAIAEAICRYRQAQGIAGPLFLGRDTHALSEPAARSAVEVLAAHGVDAADGPTPTPAVSHAILTHNRSGAAEMTARTGRDPGAAYAELTERFGTPAYRRVDAPASPARKAVLAKLSSDDVKATELAGERISAVLTEAPGNGAPIGGVKSSRSMGGSRRARRARRTSTSSTRRACGVRSIWSGSSWRPKRSSMPRWRQEKAHEH